MPYNGPSNTNPNDPFSWADRSRVKPPTFNRISSMPTVGGLVRTGNSQQRWSFPVQESVRMSEPIMRGGMPVSGTEEPYRYGVSPNRMSMATTGFIDARARRSPQDTTPSARPTTDQEWKDQFNPAKSGSADFRRLWDRKNNANVPELDMTGLVDDPSIGAGSIESGKRYADQVAKQMMGIV